MLRGSAFGRRVRQERLLLAFLNTGMWVAGENYLRPHTYVDLRRSRIEGAWLMTKTR